MPFNGAGVYSPPATDFPAVSGTLIQATKFNNVMNDIATGLSTCITVNGQSTVTANIPFGGFYATNAGIRAIAGAVGAPGISWNSDTSSGWYRIAANDYGLSIAGTKVQETIAASHTFSQNVLFSADNTYDIGASGATRARDFFLGRNATIGGTITVANTLGVTGTSNFTGGAVFNNPTNTFTSASGNATEIDLINTVGRSFAIVSTGNTWGAVPERSKLGFYDVTGGGMMLYMDGTAITTNKPLTVTGSISTVGGSISASGGKYFMQDSGADMLIGNQSAGNVVIYRSGAELARFTGTSFMIGATADGFAPTTGGLTVSQTGSAASNHSISLKLAGLTTGLTGIADTDSFGFIRQNGSSGGLAVVAICTASNIGLALRGIIGVDSATHTTAGRAPIELESQLQSGTGITSNAANQNMVAFRNNGTTVFIFDSSGVSYEHVGTTWTNFDSHNDVMLLNALAVQVARPGDPYKEAIRSKFMKDLDRMGSRADIERIGLVKFNEDGGHFLNTSMLAMLHTGAIRQTWDEVQTLRARIVQLESACEKHGITVH